MNRWHLDPPFTQPECTGCDDMGCDLCCETSTRTLDDLEDEDRQIFLPWAVYP